MKSMVLWAFLISSLFAAVSVESEWKEGEVFSTYLESHGISQSLIQNIEDTDKQFLSEIQSGVKIFELYDKGGTLLQSLIPIGEEMQIQISKDELNNEYLFDIIPIVYGVREHEVVIPITTNPNLDIMKSIHHTRLASKIDHLFKNSVDCRKLQYGDTLAMIYKQKQRLGKPFLDPEVKIAMIETNNKKKFIFVDEDGEGHNDTTKEVSYTTKGKKRVREEVSGKSSGSFGMPIRNSRISSRFTYKRWHPILKRYRPHLGVDFAAKRGTPLLAIAPGKVVFSGWKGGYGRVVKVKHSGGYVSLYAHQSRIRAKQGSYVKKGQVLGYVGSSGRSTGPHLHFGLYRNNRAMNPLKMIHKRYNKRTRMVTKIIDILNKKKVVIKGAKENKERLLKILDNPPELFSWEYTKNNFMLINDKEHISKSNKG